MSQAEQAEALDRTLAEMEAQHLAAQTVLGEALAELETLYVELEEQARLLPETAAPAVQQDGEAREDLEQLQAEMDELRGERDSLAAQLRRLRQQLPGDSWQPGEAAVASAGAALRQLKQLASPGGVAIRAPFEQLRQALGIEVAAESAAPAEPSAGN